MSHSEHNTAALVEPLTRREREVLGLLAQGLTAPEMAEQLTLAVSSVKWHIQQLYGKLGVNGKRQAVGRARELGLLGATTPVTQPPSPSSNLPLQVTRFFGREAELAQITQHLAADRLVTLTGPGGVGKTRLALRAADELLLQYPQGVWFVELAALSGPGLVAQQVATTLGLRDEPGRPVLETLVRHLRERQSLIVLDNCEHVLDDCAHLCAALLRTCPRLRVLACSREPLGVAGEVIYLVPSLPFPEPGQPLTAVDIEAYAAVRLFVDRARLVRTHYEVAAHNAPAIAAICRRVDGIPLAIEMAAARVNILTPQQLAHRLDNAFGVLSGGSRTALPRQQTLRATIDWSYNLLSEPEQRVLQRLSVFAGGCTLEAAEAVCAGEAVPAEQVLDLLGALVAKSMVVADQPPGEAMRYRLLEMIRQYAREKLEAAGERPQALTRQRDYYLAFVEADRGTLSTTEQLAAIRKRATERDNLRQAMEWSLSGQNDPDVAVRLLLMALWWPAFPHQEILNWNQRGLAFCQGRPDSSAELRVKLLCCLSALTALDDPPTAVNLAAEAVELSRAMGPEGRELLMWRLINLAELLIEDLGEPDRAVAPLEGSEAILQALGPDRYAPAEGLRVRASFAGVRAELANKQGRYADAKVHAAESIRLIEASSDRGPAARVHAQLGIACLRLGECQKARQRFTLALKLNRESQGWEVAYNLHWLAAVDLAEGLLDRALDYCQESITEAELIPDRNIIASALGLMAGISSKRGQPAHAAHLAGASAAMWARQKRKPWGDYSLDTLLPGWREVPEHEAIQAAFEAGQAMNSDEAVAFALRDLEV